MKPILLLATMMSFNALVAVAGPGDGGGGTSIICDKAQTPFARMLDTYEGEIRHRFAYPNNPNWSVEEWLEYALARVQDPTDKVILKDAIFHVQNRVEYLPDGVEITMPSDAEANGEAVLVPKGCRPGAAGYWETSGLLISTVTHNMMSNFEKAALILHEAIYLKHRQLLNSHRFNQDELNQVPSGWSRQINGVRHLTAMLLSTRGVRPEDTAFFSTPQNSNWPGLEVNTRVAVSTLTRDRNFIDFSIRFPEAISGIPNAVSLDRLFEMTKEVSGKKIIGKRFDVVVQMGLAYYDQLSSYQPPLDVERDDKEGFVRFAAGVGHFFQKPTISHRYVLKAKMDYQVFNKNGELVFSCATNGWDSEDRCPEHSLIDQIVYSPLSRDRKLYDVIMPVREQLLIWERHIGLGHVDKYEIEMKLNFGGVVQERRFRGLDIINLTIHKMN